METSPVALRFFVRCRRQAGVLEVHEYIPIARASRFFPGNPHANSVRRWASRGLHGIKLQSIRFGGKRLVTESWCREFCDAVTASSGSSMEHAQAEAKLDALGVTDL